MKSRQSKASKEPKASKGPEASKEPKEPSVEGLEARLEAAVERGLPGLAAQLPLAPQPRPGWDPHTLPEGLRDGAALLLVYPIDGIPHVLLTVRAAGLRKHKGQVSLPGGAVDAGETFEAAALREASEEVGCMPSAVRIIGRLTPVHIPVSNFHLHPVLGIAVARPDFRPAEWEVARLLEVPIDHLRGEAIVKHQTQHRTVDGKTIEIDVPYFDIDGETVWGATAMILAEFLALLRDADV